MFGINKNSNTPLVKSQERFDTLIGRQTEIQGTLRVVQSVRIDGKVIGNIEASKENAITVVIGLEGEVQGDVIASRVIVAGKVAGKAGGKGTAVVSAWEKLRLARRSRISASATSAPARSRTWEGRSRPSP